MTSSARGLPHRFHSDDLAVDAGAVAIVVHGAVPGRPVVPEHEVTGCPAETDGVVGRGGVPEQIVVVRVIALAEQPTASAPGQPLFGAFTGFESNGAMTWLRQWVASPAGRRMGLEPIPDEPVHPRRLRRTLSVEMAARPGGLLATKVHFKHLQVATSEGYAGRPG